MKENKRQVEFWDAGDEGILSHTDMDEAISYILADTNELPEKLEICGYARIIPNKEKWASDILYHLLESLDGKYGNPDGGYTEPTEEMKEAATKFVNGIFGDYFVWACEIVERKTINVMEWVKENQPEWIEEMKLKSE